MTAPRMTRPNARAGRAGCHTEQVVLTGLALVALVAGSGHVVRRAAIQVPLLIPAPR